MNFSLIGNIASGKSTSINLYNELELSSSCQNIDSDGTL
jgi:hypothetical protein